jgi:hypothetical protein
MVSRSAAVMTEAEDDTSVPIRREIAPPSGTLVNGGAHGPIHTTAANALGHMHLSKLFGWAMAWPCWTMIC